jgi:hypothetical protein
MNTGKELICGSAGRGRRRRRGYPKVDVPIKELLNCRDLLTEECEGRVDGSKYVWRRMEPAEDEISHYWADAQDVDRQRCEDREEPNLSATMRFCRFHGSGVGLEGYPQTSLSHDQMLHPGWMFSISRAGGWPKRRGY